MLGRLVTDLYPLQSETPLEEVRTFERFTGGYGGNVGIGLARLGVATAVVSGVGDDGHGRAIVRDLVREGVDTRWVTVHPTLRTALAFCELWPPDRFPLLAYRFPTCPDQEIVEADLPPPSVLLRGAHRVRVGQRLRPGTEPVDGVRGARGTTRTRTWSRPSSTSTGDPATGPTPSSTRPRCTGR